MPPNEKDSEKLRGQMLQNLCYRKGDVGDGRTGKEVFSRCVKSEIS